MKKMRLIQCGMGGMGKTWLKSATGASPDFELVAIVDILDKPLDEAGDELQIPRDRRFKSLQAALEKTVADAVLTVTPPSVHVEHAQLAFERGLHFVTEKPMAHDLAGAKLMVDLAERAGRQLVVAQNYRYSSVMQRLKSLLHEGPVGELGHGHIDFYIPVDLSGTFRQTMQFPLLVDMAIHHIDLIRAVTGRNVCSVTARAFNTKWSWFKHDAGLKMLMELDGGIPFSYSGDWTAMGRSTSWNGTWRLQCSEGSIHLEDDRISIARCQKWNENPSQQSVEIPQLQPTQQAALLHRFAEAIRTSTPAETSGRDNLQSFATVMAAVTSAQENRAIEVASLL